MADTVSPNAIRAGQAYWELVVKDKVGSGLQRASTKLKAFSRAVSDIGKGLSLVGGAMTTSFALAMRVFASSGDELAKASKRTGIGVTALSELRYAADQSATSLGGFETGVKHMQKSIAEATIGSSEAAKALAEIGTTAADLVNLKPDQQFQAIADRLNSIADPAKRTAAAMAIFGRSGTELLPMIQELNANRARAKGLGILVTPEQAAAAEHFGDAISDLGKQFKQIGFIVGAILANALQPFVDRTIYFMSRAIQWISINRSLVISVAEIGGATLAAGASLLAFGRTGEIAATSMRRLGSIIKFFAPPLIKAVAPLFSRGGLLVAGMVAATGALLYYTSAGQKLLAFLGDRFGNLKTDAISAFVGIADAMKAGDLKLAGQIAITYLKIGWVELKEFALGIISDIGFALAKAWINAFDVSKQVWIRGIGLYRQVIMDLGDEIAGLLAKSDADRKYIKRMHEQDAMAAAEETQSKVDAMEKDRQQAIKDLESMQRKGKSTGADELRRQVADLESQLGKMKDQAHREADAAHLPDVGTFKIPSFDGKDLFQQAAETVSSRGIFAASGLQALQSKASETPLIAEARAIREYVAKIANSMGYPWAGGAGSAGGSTPTYH